jgi:hypothetical protein
MCIDSAVKWVAIIFLFAVAVTLGIVIEKLSQDDREY